MEKITDVGTVEVNSDLPEFLNRNSAEFKEGAAKAEVSQETPEVLVQSEEDLAGEKIVL